MQQFLDKKQARARSLLIFVSASALTVSNAPVRAGTWLGPDLVGSDWSSWSISGTGSVMHSRVSGANLHLGIFNYVVFNTSYSATATGSRSVTVVPGKRYQYDVSAKRTRSVVREPVSSNWWTEIASDGSTSASTNSSFATKTITTLAGGSPLTLRVKSTLSGSSPGEANYCYAEYDWATLRQVVYDPQLDIAPSAIRINSDAPGGSTATIPLGLNSLSFADDPTAWSIDWGDGVVEPNPTLNSSRSHEYVIPSGNSATWTATFSGSNEAGSGSDTAIIDLLSQPDIALSVNGQSVLDGGTIEIDVVNDPILNLSLLESLGYIEATSFFIPDHLGWSGGDLTLATSIFDEFDIGQVFPLTASISNTGMGVNADQLTVNLSIVPEPSTVLLGLLGTGVILGRRRARAARTACRASHGVTYSPRE